MNCHLLTIENVILLIVIDSFIWHYCAAETEDYVSDNVTINFKSGDTVNSTRCTSVSIVDDNLLESNETFFAILLSSDDDALTASPTVTRVVIQDDRGKGTVLIQSMEHLKVFLIICCISWCVYNIFSFVFFGSN